MRNVTVTITAEMTVADDATEPQIENQFIEYVKSLEDDGGFGDDDVNITVTPSE